jgi:hypothetical protein
VTAISNQHSAFSKGSSRFAGSYFSGPQARPEYKASCMEAEALVPVQGISHKPITDTIAAEAQISAQRTSRTLLSTSILMLKL